MSDLPAKQSYWLTRFLSGIFKGYGKVEDKPVAPNHGSNWVNPYGTPPAGISPAKSLSALGGHGYTHAAVSRSAADLAALPLILKSGKGKKAKLIEDSPVLDLFENPSTWSDGFLFRETLRTDLMLSGNCYILLLGLSAKPDSIIRLHPAEVEIVTDERSGITGYRHESNGKVVIYPTDRVLHGRNTTYAKGPQSLYGCGVIEPLTREINADINAQKLASQSSARGRPDILIHPVDPADVWGLERRREILDQYRGLASEGGALVLSGQVAVEELKLTPREMEFEAARRMARESISAVCGVPPTVLGIPDANYATSRNQAIGYWSNQQKAAIRLDHLYTKIARLWNPDYSISHDFSSIEPLQSVRDAQLLRVQQHIANGISVADAYSYEMGDVPFFADQEEETTETDTRSLAVVLSRSLGSPENEKKKIWDEWIERAYTPQEKRLYRASRAYLRGAAKRYASRLRRVMTSKSLVNGSVIRAVTDWSELYDADEEKQRIQAEIGSVWMKGFSMIGAHELSKVFTKAGRDQEGVAFSGDAIAGFQISRMASEVISTSTKHVQKVVETGLLTGSPTEEIADNLLKAKAFDKSRATLIARTEATRSINAATVQAYQVAAQEGISVMKQWVTENDDRVREEHQELEGQTVYPSEMFTVPETDLQAMGPGEFGTADMDCNCRCTVIDIII